MTFNMPLIKSNIISPRIQELNTISCKVLNTEEQGAQSTNLREQPKIINFINTSNALNLTS